MKNLLIILLFVVYLTSNLSAQTKVIGGVVFASAGTTDFTDIEKPFNLGYNLLPNICIITSKTYHNILYGFANNTIKVCNGYPFGKRNLDVYLVHGISLNSGIVSIATGIEKKISADNVNFFLFTELGKDLSSSSRITLSIGFHVNIQSVIDKRKVE